MEPVQVRDARALAALVAERGLEHVRVGVFDLDGVLRGKLMSREKFLSALDKGFGFCDVVLGWDSNDQLYDSVRFTGWHTGYPDTPVRLLPGSARNAPFDSHGQGIIVLGEFAEAAESLCPRGLLRRVLERAAGQGFDVLAALEYEYFLFQETPHSLREKRFADLKPITPGNFGYSTLRSAVHADYFTDLLDLCRAMGFALEGLHTETGPGVLEAAIGKDDAMAAADKAALFKTFCKVHAQRRGWLATFMAKWSPDYPGQSGHMHISLRRCRGGRPVFDDKAGPHGMSEIFRHFVGGQQALMPELLALVAPTINSYTRLIPGFWAPTDATWGVENRTCALRVVRGGPEALRIEYRIGAADANPYLALAAAIGSGLWGIEQEIEPTAPVEGNAYEARIPARLRLPATLWEAAQALKRSKPARALFGNDFVEHFAATREWEEREFRKAITDWELSRYFEII